MRNFFSENLDEFTKFSDLMEGFEAKNESEKKLLDLVKTALSAINFNREEYDAFSPYSTSKYGSHVLGSIKPPLQPAKMQRILFHLACFVREVTLVRESRSESEQIVLDYYLGEVVREDIGAEGWESYATDFLKYALPTRLVEQKYSEIKILRDDFDSLRFDSEKKNAEYKDLIDGYQAQLDKLANEYNFVALSKAFSSLLDKKI